MARRLVAQLQLHPEPVFVAEVLGLVHHDGIEALSHDVSGERECKGHLHIKAMLVTGAWIGLGRLMHQIASEGERLANAQVAQLVVAQRGNRGLIDQTCCQPVGQWAVVAKQQHAQSALRKLARLFHSDDGLARAGAAGDHSPPAPAQHTQCLGLIGGQADALAFCIVHGSPEHRAYFDGSAQDVLDEAHALGAKWDVGRLTPKAHDAVIPARHLSKVRIDAHHFALAVGPQQGRGVANVRKEDGMPNGEAPACPLAPVRVAGNLI
ncbi:hypothetical protein D3C87_1286310 [compost metagenome]